MARTPRHRCAPHSLEPGQLYHVTNRGVDRCSLFDSDVDRVVFLSLVAEASQSFGTVCHAFCLMDTHFHLVLEDPRGVISQMMHHLGFCYARYFNDSRPRGRRGPLFESRFRAKLIDSPTYFQTAVSYVFLNPVRTKYPLSDSPDTYRWSSAALVCAATTAIAFCDALMAPMGGIAGVISLLPPARFEGTRELRRERLEAFASGAWLDRDRVLSGRSPEHYRLTLVARMQTELRSDVSTTFGSIPIVDDARRDPPQPVGSRPSFTGLDLDESVSPIERTCSKFLSTSLLTSGKQLADIVAYALWRFSSASAERIADMAGIAHADFDDMVREIHGTRLVDQAWQRLLWSLEWALRWQLRAAPHRPGLSSTPADSFGL